MSDADKARDDLYREIRDRTMRLRERRGLPPIKRGELLGYPVVSHFQSHTPNEEGER